MREILFKAKRLDNNEWVEGYYLKDEAIDGTIEHLIFQNGTMHDGKCFHKIDPNTLCQFTGLTDKDGNKIWENDIIDISDCRWCSFGPTGYDSPIVLVEWNEENCGFHPFANYDCDCDIYYLPEEVKVIGDKFDNFNLLEE